MALDERELERIRERSVQKFDTAGSPGIGGFIIHLAGMGDGIPAWGRNVKKRDEELRKFYRSEPWLDATIASIAARNAGFSWAVEGPKRTSAAIQEILHRSNYGAGWMHLIQQLTIDFCSQDNGAFIEVIRDGDGPDAPLLGLAHLDAGRVTRTGDPEIPFLYRDREGGEHKLAWWQAIDLVDNPSPIETMNGVGECGVSRVLKEAQKERDVLIYRQEKVSGKDPAAIHIVSGVRRAEIEDAFVTERERSDNAGQSRWMRPVIVSAVDPTAAVRAERIDLKALPDGFDLDVEMKWYISVLALAFGLDYQDLAPLSHGNLGTSAQSKILHLKSRGRGPELWQKQLEHKLNFFVLPKNVQFKHTEDDFEARTVRAETRLREAQSYKVYIDMGIPQGVVFQMMQDDGVLKPEYLQMMQQQDQTPDVVLTDEQRPGEERTVSQETPPNAPQGQQQPGAPGATTGQQPPPTPKARKDLGDDMRAERQAFEDQMREELRIVLPKIQRRIQARIREEGNADAGS